MIPLAVVSCTRSLAARPLQHGFEPIHALEPPVAEQLSVICRRDDAELPALGRVAGKLLFDEFHEVDCVVLNLLGSAMRLVRRFVAQIDLGPADPPVLHS